jgi:NTE family protein
MSSVPVFRNAIVGVLFLAMLPAQTSGAPGERLRVRPILVDTTASWVSPLARRAGPHPRVGLVLSGGGARGISHIGVLKVLERLNIPVDFVAATSMGAIVGGLYASGWTPAEIESLVLNTKWDEVIALTGRTDRAEQLPDWKSASDKNFLVVRFERWQPVIPTSISSGQRFTDLLNSLVLRSPYHPVTSFDDLKIPFRAVTTDLVSGRRIVLGKGPLAEAMRASATVPLIFSPIEKDSMQLVDGGLVANIPVDVARQAGCDIVIAVDVTSGLRTAEEISAPWEAADQIIGIMMQHPNEEQLKGADVVITPAMGRHLASDFHDIDSLVRAGELAASEEAGEILRLLDRGRLARLSAADGVDDRVFTNVTVSRTGEGIPPPLWDHITREARYGVVSMFEIRDHLDQLAQLGMFRDIHADVTIGQGSVGVLYTVVLNPAIDSVSISGARLIPREELLAQCAPLIGRPASASGIREAVEQLLRVYRRHGYALARVTEASVDTGAHRLEMVLDEGVINRISVAGATRTKEWYILREFGLREGEAFDAEKATQGIASLSTTGFFEHVYLEVSYGGGRPNLTIRLKEKPSQLMRFGVRFDTERYLQGSVDARDENWRGSGMELGLTASGGQRNLDLVFGFKARRIFDTYLAVGLNAIYSWRDVNLYGNAPQRALNRWDRDRTGEYRDRRYGAGISVGAQLERLGDLTAEFLIHRVALRSLANAAQVEGEYDLRLLRVGTLLDTKNSYPFPTAGIDLSLSYEAALGVLGGDVSYNALTMVYESYSALGSWFTVNPKITVAFADKSMPYSQMFSLGGQSSFYGLREDDQRGRQLLLLNVGLRAKLPFAIVFPAYTGVRYDLATISEVPEQIKVKNLRHALGVDLALDTPVGAAVFSLGRSFFFSRSLPNNPVQLGPFLFAFSIGYQL